MAVTTKTLTPTNQTVTLPDMTERPDVSVLVTDISREADAINAVQATLGNYTDLGMLTDVNITNRVSNACYHFNFRSTAENIPANANDGQGFLFVNNAATYGNMVIFAYSGMYARKLVNGVYQAWTTVFTY